MDFYDRFSLGFWATANVHLTLPGMQSHLNISPDFGRDARLDLRGNDG
jgi:hypothetical protein